jgi:hypothetical protein
MSVTCQEPGLAAAGQDRGAGAVTAAAGAGGEQVPPRELMDDGLLERARDEAGG